MREEYFLTGLPQSKHKDSPDAMLLSHEGHLFVLRAGPRIPNRSTKSAKKSKISVPTALIIVPETTWNASAATSPEVYQIDMISAIRVALSM